MAVFAVAYFSEHKTVNAAPTVNIYANGQPTFLLIDNPGNVTITWDSQGAASCLVNQGQWTGTTGSQSLYVSAKTVVDAYCQDAFGDTAAQVEISVSGVSYFDLCEPESQTASVGQTVTLTSPFAGSQTWSAPDGNPSSGTGSTFQTIYSTPGLKIVQGITGTPPKQGSDSCSVYVTQPSYSLTASPNPISPGQTTNVSWNISSIPAGSSCTIAGYMGGVERFLQSVSTTTGSFTTPALDYNHEVYLNCGYISASPSNYVATTTIKVTLTCGPSNPIVINVNELRVNGLQTLGGYVSPEGTTTSSAPGNIYASGGAWLDLQYATSGSKTITVSSSDGQTVYCGATVSTVPLTVNISLSTNPINNEAPNDITVTWDPVSGSGITCTASGAWSGSKSPSGGSEVVNAPVGGVKSFTLYCSNSTGDGQDSEQVTITNPLLLCAPNTQTVSAGSTANMSASGGLSPFTWSITSGVGGSLTSSSGSSTGLTGTAGQGYTVRVRDAASQTADCYVSFSASSGLTVSLSAALSPVNGSAPNNITLTWTITGATATACVASGDWSGNKNPTGGSQTITGVGAGTYSYTLFCSASSGNSDTDTQGATITATSIPPTVSLSLSPSQITTADSTVVQWIVGGGQPSSPCTASSSPVIASWNGTKTTYTSSQTLSGLAVGTYTLNMSCTNGAGTGTAVPVVLTVSTSLQTGQPFNGSISGTACSVDYPGTECTNSVTFSSFNAVNTMVRRDDGATSTTIFCQTGSFTSRLITDVVSVDVPVTYTLHNAPNCSYVPPTGVPNEVVIMWDNSNPASFPAGWTCISCSGGPLNNKMPMASSTSGTGGGDDANHSHSLTISSSSGAQGTYSAPSASIGSAVSLQAHTHSWPSSNSQTASHLPPFQNLVFLKSSGATSLPAGAIAIFEGALPSIEWSAYSTSGQPMDGKYLRAGADTLTGGSASHTHGSTSITSGGGTADRANPNAQTTVAGSGHYHNFNVTLGTSATNAPVFANLLFGKLQNSSTVPEEMVSPLLVSVSGWTLISNTGSVYNNVLLKGSSTSGGSGGNNTHSHEASVSGNSTNSTGGSAPRVSWSGGTTNYASSTHYHSVTYTVGNSSALPAYYNVMLSKHNLLGSVTLTALQNGGGPRSELVSSNKDIAFIRNSGITYNYQADADSNATEVEPIAEGDDVSFAIHILNSGPGTAVGDIQILDILSNLVPSPYPGSGDTPDTLAGWRAVIYCNDPGLSSATYKELYDPNFGGLTTSSSCDGQYTLNPAVTYEEDINPGQSYKEDGVTFTISPVGGTTLGQNEVITLVYTTKAQGPVDSPSSVFRLKNTASLYYNDSVDGSQGVAGTIYLETPAVLFYRNLEVPIIKEAR